MTNENINKANQIARRIEELQRIEELLEIENFHSKKRENILTYAYKKCNNDYSVFPSWATNPILPLLAKHDGCFYLCKDTNLKAIHNGYGARMQTMLLFLPMQRYEELA